jgi:hypothetical protein
VKDPVPLVIVGVLNTLLPAVTPTVPVLLEVIPSQVIALEVAPPARLTDPEAKKCEPEVFLPNISEVPFALNILNPYDIKELY